MIINNHFKKTYTFDVDIDLDSCYWDAEWGVKDLESNFYDLFWEIREDLEDEIAKARKEID